MKKKIIKISLVGKTNAGKSTLLNHLVGELISITNKKINTTEDLIAGILNIKYNQIIIYDTPGISFLKENNKSNIKLKKNLWSALEISDLIIYVIDSSKYNFKEIDLNIQKLNELDKKISIIFNKNDLIDKKSIISKTKEIQNKFKIDAFFNISAKKKYGLHNIINYMLKNSYYSNWIYDQNDISNKDDLFISNECTRNNILSFLHKEIPYNVKIINKIFKYLKNGDLKIKQEIIINNLRYKKIILGKNGEKIKQIRIKTQNEISKIFKVKVHLYININTKNAEKN